MITLLVIKRGLVIVWAIWLIIVLLTNITEFLRHHGVLNKDFKFVSHNYDELRKKTGMYDLPEWVPTTLFLAVMVWQAVTLLLFWRAVIAFDGINGMENVYTAFGSSLAIWGAFLIADEIFIAYRLESAHRGWFTSQLVTLLAIVLLPA